jgi:YgiT-type zinc finger domain-containing protein
MMDDVMNNPNPCEFCDTDEPQVKRLVTVTRQRHGQWYIFEDVPAWVCPHCGHRYFDADVLQTMEGRMTAAPADARPITAWAISLAESAE